MDAFGTRHFQWEGGQHCVCGRPWPCGAAPPSPPSTGQPPRCYVCGTPQCRACKKMHGTPRDNHCSHAFMEPPSTGQSREQGEVCKRCLEPVDVVWLAPDWLWEKARTSPDDLGHNVLCVRCFSLAAEGAGFPVWFEARRHAAEPCIPRKDVAVLDLCDIASRHRECGPYCADLRAEFAAALESKP
jgi:hypothetical protein